MRLPLPRRDQGAAATLVVLMHLALLWLVLGSRPHLLTHEAPSLATFDVPLPTPPPPAPPAATAPRPAAPQGTAGRATRRTPVAAPSPVVPQPTLVVAAPVPDSGNAPSGGNAAAGAGTGMAGLGSGAGAGGAGNGTGGGGGTRARLVKGAIRNRDYPKAERKSQVQGTVTAAFTVGSDGRVRNCRIQRSSGSTALDAVTCKLIAERFRYAPATDTAGHPVAEERGWQQRWWIADEPGA